MSLHTRTYKRSMFAIIPGNGVTLQFGTRGLRLRRYTEDTRPTAWIAKDAWQPVQAPSLPVLVYRVRAILCF